MVGEEGEAYCCSYEVAEEEMVRILGMVKMVVVEEGEEEGVPFDYIPDHKEEVDDIGAVEVENTVGEGGEVGAFVADSLVA
jgi:hypothetical protein